MQETQQQATARINAMAPGELKVFENRLRRAARRQRLSLQKSRRRDPRAPDFGGYMLVDERNYVVAGATHNAFELGIVGVARFLNEEIE